MRDAGSALRERGPARALARERRRLDRALRAARERDGRGARAARLGHRHAPPALLLVSAPVPARDVLGRPSDRPRPTQRDSSAARPACTRSRRAGSTGCARTAVFAYRLPEESFEPHPEVGGYWVAGATVEPVDGRPLGDLVARHERAEIELRVVPNLWPLWDEVVASTLEFSGMRLRNALPGAPARRAAASSPSRAGAGNPAASARSCGGRRSPAATPRARPRAARRRGRRVPVRGRADPENDRATLRDERQAPLRRDRRLRERLRDRDLVTVSWLGSRRGPRSRARFGSSSVQRSRNSVFRRSASSSVTSRSGSDAASGIPGVPPPLPTSTIGPSKRAHELESRQRVVEQDAARLGRVAQRGQPRRREDGREPAVEEVRRRRGGGR